MSIENELDVNVRVDEETITLNQKPIPIEVAVVLEEDEIEFNSIKITEPVKLHLFKIVFIPNVKYIVFFLLCLFAYGNYYFNKNDVTPPQ